MNARSAQLTFAEMLEFNRRETAKWQSWLERQPDAVLDLPLHIAQANSVRGMLLHIMAVELRYAERLNEVEVTPYEAHAAGGIGELFAIGAKGHALYSAYLARTTDEDLAVVLEFPTRTSGVLRSSKRKMFAHAMLHSIRHWAQLATALREQGHASDWPHDFIFSDLMV